MEYGVICGILLIKILKGNINQSIVGIILFYIIRVIWN